MQIRPLGKSIVPSTYLSHERRIFDVMVHGLEFQNDTDEQVVVDSVVLALEKGSDAYLKLPFEGGLLRRAAEGAGAMLNAAFSTPYVFEFLFSRGYSRHSPWTPALVLEAGECFALTHLYMTVLGVKPTRLSVTVRASGDEVRRNFRLKTYEPKNRLVFPVPGRARCYNGPATGVGHHRQTTTQEFAYDTLPFDTKGRIVRGKGERNRDFGGFGAPLVAPAPGYVVHAFDGMPDNASPGRMPELSPEFIEQWGLLHAVAGNYVVLRHRHGEYSFLAHCRKGSIVVSEGDRVSRGQELARLGNTGNSSGPHLHYHLMDGPDLLRSRSLPVRFDDIDDFVTAADEAGEFHAVPDPSVTTQSREA